MKNSLWRHTIVMGWIINGLQPMTFENWLHHH
jgi:hypothetical protein